MLLSGTVELRFMFKLLFTIISPLVMILTFMGLVECIVYLATNCGVAEATETSTPVRKPLHQRV
jgi:hypothetical protein